MFYTPRRGRTTAGSNAPGAFLVVSAALPVQAKNLSEDWSVSDWYNYGINCGTGSWFGTPKGRPSALSFAEAFISKHQ